MLCEVPDARANGAPCGVNAGDNLQTDVAALGFPVHVFAVNLGIGNDGQQVILRVLQTIFQQHVDVLRHFCKNFETNSVVFRCQLELLVDPVAEKISVFFWKTGENANAVHGNMLCVVQCGVGGILSIEFADEFTTVTTKFVFNSCNGLRIERRKNETTVSVVVWWVRCNRWCSCTWCIWSRHIDPHGREVFGVVCNLSNCIHGDRHKCTAVTLGASHWALFTN